ncbi:hypothetical protein CEQ90_19100 [Lewinellaceae bacterium SD302]|nr:hypothetical protein CEQ90_19100 [Lewinellaceae bacterium SD302]
MIARTLLSLSLFISIATLLVSQKLDYHQGQLIVQLQSSIDGKNWAGQQPEVDDFRQLIASPNVWLLYFDYDQYAEAQLRSKLNRDPLVEGIQFNRFVDFRATEPNDPFYPQQWQYNNTGQIGGLENADANICEAWDISTGGVTVNGDTIVICAIDNGVDEDHEDLVPNIWINRDEIAGNGIDDDNNGFIDDRKGWNTAANNNDINGGNHGTAVTGIIGARGDNGLGVAGVNWTAKVMIVRNNFNASEAEVLESYGYALQARRDYDNSGGTAGAYVVATNASWGISGGDPADSPLWCALYDTLGNYGILNAGATANENLDVDADGDLPTACPSDFLISVTNVDTNDEKVMNAAFGLTTIDLGAHGEDVFTTSANNNYGAFGGTSAATPMVAGAIGLLYSVPAPVFGELLEADPAAAALLVRAAILDNARPLDDLDGITVTGGVLDLGAAMIELNNLQSTCLPPTSVAVETVGATSLEVSWNVVSSVNSVNLRYRPQGTVAWTTETEASSPFIIENIEQCQVYELQLLSICGNTAAATPISLIETDGCCRRPNDFTLTPEGTNAFRVDFSTVLAAVEYRIRYRPVGTANWTQINFPNPPLLVDELLSCTPYEVEIKTNCDTSITTFGDRMEVQTGGCGVCLDTEYCVPQSIDNSAESIAYFAFGDLLNETGAEPDGYRNYGQEISVDVARGAGYPVELRPAFEGNTFSEAFRIWIDFNQDGFLSSNEVVFEENFAAANPTDFPVATALIPDNALLGSTRMRVLMRFNVFGSSCQVGNFFGEIEDYCVNVTESPGCVPPSTFDAVYDETTAEVTLSWSPSNAPGGEYLLRYRPNESGDEWEEVVTEQLTITLEDFPACQLYEAELYSLCGENDQSEAITTVFNSCSSTHEPSIPAGDWSLSPNPTAGPVTLHYRGQAALSEISIYDLLGRQFYGYQGSSADGSEMKVIQLADLPAGIYFLRIRTVDGLVGVRRLVKE